MPAAALAVTAPAPACAPLAAAVAPVWAATGRLSAAGRSTTLVCEVGAIVLPTEIAAPVAAADPLAAEIGAADAELTCGRVLVAPPSGIAAALPEVVWVKPRVAARARAGEIEKLH